MLICIIFILMEKDPKYLYPWDKKRQVNFMSNNTSLPAAEVVSSGHALPYAQCRIRQGEGCLAMVAVHGEDYRLNSESYVPCPIYSVREVELEWNN